MLDASPPVSFGEIGPPWWHDRPVLVVGTGRSLQGFAFERLRDLGHILAVKRAVADLPFADACFGLDLPWMQNAKAELTEVAARMPLYLAVPDQHPLAYDVHVPGAIYLKRGRTCERLTETLGAVESGANSGFGALNVAYLKRARQIFLFGFDYHPNGHYCQERY